MKELYQSYQLRAVMDGLNGAQHAIESIVVKNEEETIFDYKEQNPELYKLYMEINEIGIKLYELNHN